MKTKHVIYHDFSLWSSLHMHRPNNSPILSLTRTTSINSLSFVVNMNSHSHNIPLPLSLRIFHVVSVAPLMWITKYNDPSISNVKLTNRNSATK